MRIKRRLKVFCLLTFSLFLFCEFAIYYIAIFQCSWPGSSERKSDLSGDGAESSRILTAMFVADTHLLGPVRGHWFDKLRREWQMYRSFQTAIQIFNPEVVFFLGDIFDEGEIVSNVYFSGYVSRFYELFSVPPATKSYIIVGNHDIGFHYWINPTLKNRFERAFNSSAIRRIRLKDNNFILINSMAMEQDGCFLCKPALKRILKISGDLDCERTRTDCASNVKVYSRPILLQHFPLYRKSDQSCTGDDAAPEKEKDVPFREKMDCISSSSSQLLLKKFEPRLVLSGHTHHGCLFHHPVTFDSDSSISTVPEYSVPSFSWRNRDNPSFFLGHFTKDTFDLSKCYLPTETTVIHLYYIGAWFVLLMTGGYIPKVSRRTILPNAKLIVILLTFWAGYSYIKH